jgi:antitoxin component YwqK of YwqJK toxin-antitoxin module
MQPYITIMEKLKTHIKYKKIPHNNNAILIRGVDYIILSFDPKYKEYLNWREENPKLEKEITTEVEQYIRITELYNNGAPHVELDENGDRQGKCLFYYENGNLKWEGEYKDHILHGELIQYRENGTIKSKEEFVNGVHIGKYEYYHLNGEPRQTGTIKEPNRQHGEIKTFWISGNLYRIDNFNYGVRHGKMVTYEVDGKSILQSGQYENNYRVGDWFVYYVGNENKIKRTETYDNSALVKVIDWNENSQKVSEGIKSNGGYDIWRNIAWYENGVKKHDTNYKNNKLDGSWTEWYMNGQKRSEGNMKFGTMDGNWVFYYHSGNKELECEFALGNPFLEAKIYHDNGVLKEELKL